MFNGPKSKAFQERARKVIPLGVNSNFRYWGEEGSPVVADAKGAYIYDFDGNRYIDYRLGFGPVILGHSDEYVTQRVTEAIQHGISFAATQEYEVKVAERIVQLCPGVEMVRITNTGSECTMHALRLARGYTGRDIILKFEGSYHGAHDYVLWSTAHGKIDKMGTRQQPIGYKVGVGVPDRMQELIQLCPWNDVEILGDILQRRGHEIAGIIVEPVLGNAAAMQPSPGFLQFLRDQCDEHGIVLIFDEVKTGFRLAPGGAREYFGVIPDVSTYAKAMGNGYPIAAFGGKKEVMNAIGPGKVFHGGTYAGNSISTAASDATLELIQSGQVFEQINNVGGQLMRGIDEVLTRYSLPHNMHGTPGMFGFSIMETPPRDWRDVYQADWGLYEKIAEHLVLNGIMPDPDGLEPWFMCSAHSEADAAETLQKFEEAVKSALGS